MAEDRFIATPTLIIGVGGTGLKVATFVKKSLLEANRNELPERMAILVLDTEKEIKYKAGGWGQERSKHHATGPVKIESAGEYVPLVGNVKPLGSDIKNEQLEAAANPRIRRGQAHRHISSWFQAQYYIDEAGIDAAVWNLDVGAGRFRQFGRLGLFSHSSTVTTMLGSVLQALSRMGATQVYVHVAGSLAGGTGAALFADVAHIIKQLAPSAGFVQSPVVFGHFVLPEGFRGTPEVKLSDPGVRADFDARGYAALRELTRLQGTVVPRTGGYSMVYDPHGTGVMNAKLSESPYSAVYLYDGVRPSNPLNVHEIEDGLAPAIADAIAAYVDDKSAGAFCSHSVNYKAFYPAYNIPTGQVTYGSVGTYTIELPVYHITEGWAHSLATEVLDTILEPSERDKGSGVPVTLGARQPGGTSRDPQADAEGWLNTEHTALVAQLAEWGMLAGKTSTLRQQAVDAALGLDAVGWQQKLAPSDPAWRVYVAESQTELEGSLKDPKNIKYFVDHNQPGDSDEQRAENLQSEVEAKLRQMVGESKDVWLRAGGDFRNALVRLGNHHVKSFDDALVRWLQIVLNGDPNVGTPVERKHGKLGYVKTFLEQLDMILKGSAGVLTQAASDSKAKRKPLYDAIEDARKEAAAEMRKRGGFRGANRRKYRDKSDELAQFHKADIARQVAYELVERLQISIEQALEEIARWERILGTAKASEGGAYALVVEGRKEVKTDREKAKNATRWVIADDEPGDTYISDKYEQYSRGKLDEILRAVEWKVGRTNGSGPLRVDFTLDRKLWDRVAGSAGQRARGVRNVSLLLDECRAAYNVAWSDMPVTEYLAQNYGHRVDELAKKIFERSGLPLSLVDPTGQPPMRTTFVRVYKAGLGLTDINFLTALRTAVAKNFKETTTAEQRAEAAKGQDYISDSGEDSRDRFKLTFVMFGDLLRPEEIAGYWGARRRYHEVSSRGSDWKLLHVLPAETNALEIERNLSTGPQAAQQRRRELSEEVVAVLEDINLFHLARRCLAYEEIDYDWEVEGERGVLLHRYTPPRTENPSGLSYWRLMVEPVGVRHGDGRIYTPDGRLARPEHYQLTAMASEPDLLGALIQFGCVRTSWRGSVPIDMDRVEATLQHMMDRHRQEWVSDKDMGWLPTDRTERDAQLFEEAQDKAAQIIRLNALIAQADQELGKYRWAWAPTDTPPANIRPDEQVKIQRYVDLWTALRGAAEEELENLGRRLGQLGTWKGSIPSELIPFKSDVPTEPVSEEIVPGEGGWVCSKGHRNLAEDGFCTECGEPRPEMPIVKIPEEIEAPQVRMCAQGHEMPPWAKFCPECGSPPRVEEAPQVRVCAQGHEMPPGAKFCPECGSPPKAEDVPQVRVCAQGHEMPAEAKFCPECGSPPKAEEAPQVRVCEQGHEMPAEAKFCPECGSPSR